MKKIIIALVWAFPSFVCIAQDASTSSTSPTSSEKTISEYSSSSIGLGLGLDYGGIGVKLSLMPSQGFALFGSLGYNIVGAGYNVGATVKLAPAKRVCPTLTGMYGYNALIIVKDDYNNSRYEKTYYGPSFGVGVEFHNRYKNTNFFNLELLIPIRSSKYHDTLDDLKNAGADITGGLPFTVSLGYHFGFRK